MLDHLSTPARGKTAPSGQRTGRRLSRFPKKASPVELALLIAAIVAVLVLVFCALGSYVTSAFKPVCDPLTATGSVATTTCSTH